MKPKIQLKSNSDCFYFTQRMNNMSQRKKAIILGAGPVGLVAAWELLKNDWCVSIYEKINIVGGMCRTWKWDDFYVDTGPHIFHTPDQNLASFWEKEFGDLFVKGEFWCKNVRGEKFDELWEIKGTTYKYPAWWIEEKSITDEELKLF